MIAHLQPPANAPAKPVHSAECLTRGRARQCDACEGTETERFGGGLMPWLQVWPLHTDGPPRKHYPGPLSPGMVRRPRGGRLDEMRMGDLAALAERVRESGWDAETHAADDTDPKRARWRHADELTRRKLAIEDDIMGRTT